MRTFVLILVFLLSLIFYQPNLSFAQSSSEVKTECEILKKDIDDISNVLDRWISWRRAMHKTPSISLGLVCNDQLLWEKSYGYSNLEEKSKATSNTTYRIASITKTFTAIGVLQLRDEGKLSLTDPVVKYLPWLRFRNSGDYQEITIKQLLKHTAGIPTNSTATNFNTMTQPEIETVKEQISSQSIVFEPGTTYKYSNLGFALLGELIAQVSGISYNVYIRENILKPLGMNNSLVHPSPSDIVATGYAVLKEDGSRRVAAYQDLAYSTPAGGIASNVYDMARYISFQLEPEKYPHVLKIESVTEMQQLQWEVEGEILGSGYSWFVDKRNKIHQISHGGGLPSQTSQLQIDLTNNIGVIVMTNSQDGEPSIYAEEVLSITRLALRKVGSENKQLEKYTGHFAYKEWEAQTIFIGNTLYLVYSLLADRVSYTFTELSPTDKEHAFIMQGGPNPGEYARFIFDKENERLKRLETPGFYFNYIGK